MTDTTITAPGVYDIPAEAYHADPCPAPSLSSGIAKILLTKTPAHARLAHPRLNPDFEPEEKTAFDIGSAAHAMMLHDDRAFAVLDFPDYRTAAAKAARDAARAEGKIPLLDHQFDQVRAMVAAGRAQLDAHPEAWEAFRAGYGQGEVTLAWQDGPEDAPIWCRIRLDWKPSNGNVVWDYKTTAASAAPDEWARTMLNTGADVQLGLYTRGITRVLGIEQPQFRFVVQETEPPFALAVHTLDPHWTHIAWRKADTAIRLWSWCLRNDRWPGYVGRVHYLECPVWESRRWEEREERGDDRELLEQALRWQAPDEASGEAAADFFRGAC